MHHKNSEKIVAIADDDDQTLSYYGNAMVTPEKQTKIQDKENNFRDSNRKPEVGEFNLTGAANFINFGQEKLSLKKGKFLFNKKSGLGSIVLKEVQSKEKNHSAEQRRGEISVTPDKCDQEKMGSSFRKSLGKQVVRKLDQNPFFKGADMATRGEIRFTVKNQGDSNCTSNNSISIEILRSGANNSLLQEPKEFTANKKKAQGFPSTVKKPVKDVGLMNPISKLANLTKLPNSVKDKMEPGHKYARNGKLLSRGTVNPKTKKLSGFGVEYTTNGAVKNLGIFDKKSKIHHGYGLLNEILENGQKLVYRGHIKAAKKHGFGIQCYQVPKDQIYTIGTFKNDLWHGDTLTVYGKDSL
jgi:hypothetical protein